MKIIFATTVLILGLEAQASHLPDIFSASETEKSDYCSDESFKSESHWRKLMSQKIMNVIGNRNEVIRNSYVSLSYLELFQTEARYNPAKFMGYVYANASNHLGRLVRFTKWPTNHPLKKDDQKLVKGVTLRIAAGVASHELSTRLMLHSLELYKELSWSLGAAVLCGNDYALDIVSDVNLRKAYKSEMITDFIEPFVTYEQTYLQKAMYSDFLIGSSAKAGVLDEMRFISFNGEEHQSFHDWKSEMRLKETSFDLKKRIAFDSKAIKNELKLHLRRNESLARRARNAKIEETAQVFIRQ